MTVNVYKDNALSGRLIAVAPMLLGALPIDVLTKPFLCATLAGLVVNTVCDAFEKRSFVKNRLGLVSASLTFGLLAGAGLQSAADLNAAARHRENDIEYRAVPRLTQDDDVVLHAGAICQMGLSADVQAVPLSDGKTYRQFRQANGQRALVFCPPR